MTAPIAQGPVDVNVRGRWEHCSPELLLAGIDCGRTPRRPCECEHGGSHDHFLSDDRLEIEAFDANGKRVQWWIGPTQAELEAAHLAGTCHALCAYCITEAEALEAPNAYEMDDEPTLYAANSAEEVTVLYGKIGELPLESGYPRELTDVELDAEHLN